MGAPPADRPWRCFVAIAIGDELRSDLAAAVARLRAGDPDRDATFRWTEPDGWHVTLGFLGATVPDEIPRLAGAVRAVAADHQSFEVTTGGLGAFPSARRARVIWYRVADPEGQLRALARSTRQALEVEDGSPFRAHLTLARARADRGAPLDDGLLAAELPSGRIEVDRLVLYRSHLGRGPARYEALAEAPLAAAAGAAARVASPA